VIPPKFKPFREILSTQKAKHSFGVIATALIFDASGNEKTQDTAKTVS